MSSGGDLLEAAESFHDEYDRWKIRGLKRPEGPTEHQIVRAGDDGAEVVMATTTDWNTARQTKNEMRDIAAMKAALQTMGIQ